MSKNNSQDVKVEDEKKPIVKVEDQKKKPTATMAEKTTDIFTAREQEIMLNALLCMKEAPTVDFTDLAARLGMSNVRSASNAWAALRKKIQERNPNPDGTPVLAAPKRTPATGNKRKKAGIPTSPVTPTVAKKDGATVATAADDNDDSADEADIKPAAKRAKSKADDAGEPKAKVKRIAKPRVKKEKAVATAPADDGEEEEASVVIKKTPAKTATPRKRAAKVVKSEAIVVKSEDEEGADQAEDMAATAEEAIKVAQAAAVAKANGEQEYAGGYAVDDDDSEGVEVIGGPGEV